MKAMITGGAGYIGSHTVLNLLDNGHDVTVVDDLSQGHEWAIDKRARFVKADIADEEMLHTVICEDGIDTIIHFAGSIVVPESVREPLKYYENNTVKSRSLIATAIRGGVKNFVFSSTAAVYGTPQKMPIDEQMPLSPESPYGSSKMMTEIMLRDVHEAYELSCAILRYFNVAGADIEGRAGQSSKLSTHLIKIACEVASGKRAKMSIFGDDYATQDGTCVRDYIHVSDLADAHRLAVEHLQSKGGMLIANCGYGQGYSVREVIDTVSEVSSCGIAAPVVDRRAGDPAELVADSTFIRETLGWQPKYNNLELIVQSALEWEKKLASRAL